MPRDHPSITPYYVEKILPLFKQPHMIVQIAVELLSAFIFSCGRRVFLGGNKNHCTTLHAVISLGQSHLARFNTKSNGTTPPV